MAHPFDMSILAVGAAAGAVAWTFVVAVLLLSAVVSAIAVAVNPREAITASKARVFICYLVSGGLCPSHLYKRDEHANPLSHFI